MMAKQLLLLPMQPVAVILLRPPQPKLFPQRG
jgi:hypothetical protein